MCRSTGAGSSSSSPEGDVRTPARGAPTGAEWLDAGCACASSSPPSRAIRAPSSTRQDGAVDNLALMEALDRAVDRHRRRSSVSPLRSSRSTPTSPVPSTRTRGRFFATRLVLATGAWAAGIPGLPRRIPVRPVRGQLLRLAQCPVRHVTYGGGGYLVPRGDTVLVGATSEEAGFENETSLAGLAALRHIAARAVPTLGAAVVVDHWAGLRPMSLDGHPILGPDPDSPALVYACGLLPERDPVRPVGGRSARRRARRDTARRARALPRRPPVALRDRRLIAAARRPALRPVSGAFFALRCERRKR